MAEVQDAQDPRAGRERPRMAQALRDAGFQAEWSPELRLEPELRGRILLIRGSSQLDPMKAFLASVMLGPRRPQTASPVTPRFVGQAGDTVVVELD